MNTISLPLSVIERIPLIWKAAADRARSSPMLSGVCICDTASSGCGIAIVATDGKFLVEESYPIDAGTMIDCQATIGGHEVGMLKDWCKAMRNTMHKRMPDCTVEVHIRETEMVINQPGSPIGHLSLRLVQGTYCSYRGAFTGDVKPWPARTGVQMIYMARLDDLWTEGARSGCSMEMRKGIIIRPLNRCVGMSIDRVALLMPITLADN
jgi:hypothetical protein